MEFDRLEYYKRKFPHWIDKNPYSNFSRILKVLVGQEHDKNQKIKALDYARRIDKPLKVWKEQHEPYLYDMNFTVTMDNLKTVNVYINPIIDDNEEITGYEKCFTEEYKEDGTNNFFKQTFEGDTHNGFTTPTVSEWSDDYLTDYQNMNQLPPIIPNDTFILEAITYDGFRWVKGYPENDNDDLFNIYREKKSYTEYLTFEIRKQNIKRIQILKNGEIAFEKELYKLVESEDGMLIYHDYKPTQKVEEYEGVLVSDVDDDNYKFQFILKDEDFNEDGTLKDIYDLKVYLYDKTRPSCEEYVTLVQKRWNGTDKNQYDCFSHDLSLDMIGRYWSVPRLKYINKNPDDDPIPYYRQTLPPFNDRLTEDDYHYQNRIKEYIYKYNKEHFPVLELWKNYGVHSTLFNRKDILSRMDKSYIYENLDYYDGDCVTEQSRNKLNIIEGLSNTITIDNYVWDETVICNNLFVVPKTDYLLKYEISFNEPVDFDTTPATYHLYYFDKKGNCHHQEKISPEMTEDIPEKITGPVMMETGANTYQVTAPFKTIGNACKLDIVLECDHPFTYSKATLNMVTMADSTPMFMTTKKDYNSCVYELLVDYKNIPLNVDFTNDNIFQKLLQRSLPLSHKGYLNIDFESSNMEYPTIEESFELEVLDFFDYESSYGTNQNRYEHELSRFIKPGSEYQLKATFKNDEFDENSNCQNIDARHYITASLVFIQDWEHYSDTNYHTTVPLEKIQAKNETTMICNFTCPEDYHILRIIFECEYGFSYRNLSLKRKDKIQEDELWTNI